MVLTVTKINTIAPRGGPAGTAVVVTGSNFGIAPGTIIFDPLGADGGPFSAAITSWADDLILFTVPAGVPANKFTVLQIIRDDVSDFDSEVWWTPAAFPPDANDGLDFQYPNFEEGGPAISDDDPRLIQAADFNRVLDRVNFAIATSTGDMLKSVYDPDDDGIVSAAVALDGTAGPGAGTLKTWADIVALVGSSGGPTVVRSYAVGVSARDVVFQRADGLVDRASAANGVAAGTAPAMGVVEAIDSPTVGQAIVRFAGDLSGFTGLSVGAVYILSRSPGKIIREDLVLDPDYPDTPGDVVQEVGIGGPGGTTLFVGTNRDFIVV